jgi:Anaerobic dehydrogenases, typically selenocysteine-containing
MMNREDMQANGWQSGDYVDLIGHYEGEERIAPHFMLVPFDIPRTCIATYFPEANVLVPLNSYAERSHTPASKLVIIQIKKNKTVTTN